mmetsp:Transcript_10836/g.29394  ORF Transcript_10836/g.29394 Transcript_10836/m.29394 type:complete len:220 (-) Transcript_10836:2011-2670(-)
MHAPAIFRACARDVGVQSLFAPVNEDLMERGHGEWATIMRGRGADRVESVHELRCSREPTKPETRCDGLGEGVHANDYTFRVDAREGGAWARERCFLVKGEPPVGIVLDDHDAVISADLIDGCIALRGQGGATGVGAVGHDVQGLHSAALHAHVLAFVLEATGNHAIVVHIHTVKQDGMRAHPIQWCAPRIGFCEDGVTRVCKHLGELSDGVCAPCVQS